MFNSEISELYKNNKSTTILILSYNRIIQSKNIYSSEIYIFFFQTMTKAIFLNKKNSYKNQILGVVPFFFLVLLTTSCRTSCGRVRWSCSRSTLMDCLWYSHLIQYMLYLTMIFPWFLYIISTIKIIYNTFYLVFVIYFFTLRTKGTTLFYTSDKNKVYHIAFQHS